MMTITKPEALDALNTLWEYFDQREDIKDGPHGEQLPNEEMKLKRLVNELLVYVNRTIPYSLK